MQFTNNYNLKKPGYSDIADIPEHFNDNMDTIDAKLKENADNISNLEGTGRTTETVKGNSDSIASLSGEGRTTETVKKNADDIGTLSTQMADLATKEELNAHKADYANFVANRFRAVQITRSTSIDSGIQEITGVGFKPTMILLIATVTGSAGKMSIGVAESTRNYMIFDIHNSTPNAYQSSGALSIAVRESGASPYDARSYYGKVTEFKNDGFILDWTKGANIVGGDTISITAICFK